MNARRTTAITELADLRPGDHVTAEFEGSGSEYTISGEAQADIAGCDLLWLGPLIFRGADGSPHGYLKSWTATRTEPAIEEPTGIGAVVRRADGAVAVRVAPTPDARFAPWYVRTPSGGLYWRRWDEMDVVEVLSEGVQL